MVAEICTALGFLAFMFGARLTDTRKNRDRREGYRMKYGCYPEDDYRVKP